MCWLVVVVVRLLCVGCCLTMGVQCMLFVVRCVCCSLVVYVLRLVCVVCRSLCVVGCHFVVV